MLCASWGGDPNPAPLPPYRHKVLILYEDNGQRNAQPIYLKGWWGKIERRGRIGSQWSPVGDGGEKLPREGLRQVQTGGRKGTVRGHSRGRVHLKQTS